VKRSKKTTLIEGFFRPRQILSLNLQKGELKVPRQKKIACGKSRQVKGARGEKAFSETLYLNNDGSAEEKNTSMSLCTCLR